MKAPPSNVCVVLGMHRGGTSAMMGALRLLGISPGDKLLPDKDDNASGFWEHADIIETHEDLLDRLDSNWHDLAPLPENWWKKAAARPFRRQITAIIRRDFSDRAIWGVKDPRFCRLLPLWLDILRELNCQPKFLMVIRHPLEVAASLQKRDGFSKEKSLLLWLDHMLQGEFLTRSMPRSLIFYPNLLGRHRGELQRIGKELDLPWPRSFEEADEDLTCFLNAGLRHHQSKSWGRGSNDIADMAKRAYQVFRNRQTVEELPSQLDPIREELCRAAALMGPPLRQQRRELNLLGHEVEEARKAHVARDQNESRLREKLQAQTDQLAPLRHDREKLERARAAIAKLKNELAEQCEESKRLSQEASKAIAARDKRLLEIEAARENIDQLVAEIETARRSHGARDKVEASLRESLERQGEELERSREMVVALSQEVEQASRSHQARDAIEASLRENLSQYRDQLLNARETNKKLAAEIERARQSHSARDHIEASLRETLEHHRDQLADAQKANEKLATEIEHARQSHSARDHIEDSLREDLEHHREQLLTARASNEKLAAEIERARQSHSARDHIEASLREEIARAETAFDLFQDQQQRAKAALEAQSAEVEKARENARALAEELDLARMHIDSINSELDVSRELNENLKQQIEAAKQGHQQKDDQIRAARNNIHQLAREIEAARGTINALVEEIERARQAHRARDLQEKKLTEALALAGEQADQRDLELKALQAQNRALNQRVETLTEEVAGRDRTIDQLETNLRQANQSLADARDQADSRQQKIEALLASFAALKSQWRYRITHPVEWFESTRKVKKP